MRQTDSPKAWASEPHEAIRREEAGRIREALAQAEAGDWTAAAEGLADCPWVLAGFPLPAAQVLLQAGRRPEAIEVLSEAQRRRPADARITHALLLACVHTLEATWDDADEGGAESTIPAERAIAAWVTLLHQDAFWARWLAVRLAHYGPGSPPLPAARQELVDRFGRRLELLLGRSCFPDGLRLLLRWELAGAEQLADAGGLPIGEGDQKGLVCGPLMLRLLGWEKRFGDFFASLRHPATDRVLRFLQHLTGEGSGDRRPVDARTRRRLQLLFSSLGRAAVLLELQRPQEALSALAQLPCRACLEAGQDEISFPSAGAFPAVCTAGCPELDRRNPGYAGLPDKAQAMSRQGLKLALRAHLAVARKGIAVREMKLEEAVASWQRALRTADLLGRRARTRQRIEEVALGRAKSLKKTGRLDAGIDLLRAAQSLELKGLPGELAGILARRGVQALKDKPPRWRSGVADLREAVRSSPHSSRALVNLSRALRNWAKATFRAQPDQAIDKMLEALQELRRGSAHLSGQHAVERQLGRARTEALSMLGGRVGELRRKAELRQALELLERGMRLLPKDPPLEDLYWYVVLDLAERLAEEGQIPRASGLLKQVIRELRGNITSRLVGKSVTVPPESEDDHERKLEQGGPRR